MKRRAISFVAAIICISSLFTGCVALVAATGVAAGAGGYAWTKGKLTFTASHDIMSCHDATIATLAELGVKITGDTTDMLEGRVMGRMATGKSVTVTLKPFSKNITKIGIRVGVFGNEVQSRTIANGINRRL